MEYDVLIEFGLHVKFWRKKAGYSQEKLAELTGFHRTYIAMVESGKRNISLKNIDKFSKAFNIPIHELMNLNQNYYGS